MAITAGHDFFVQWHLTERCNLRCKHCYQDGTGGDELSFGEIQSVIEEVSDTLSEWSESYGLTFSPSYNITGGEPFLRNDLFDILADIVRKGAAIYLLTNGTLIDAAMAKQLSDIGVKGVQVSIEGPEQIHESIRGKGSFGKSLDGVRHLLNAGLRVTLNATISDVNADYLIDLVTLSSSLGVQRLGVSRLVPSGRGMGMINSMLPSEKIRELYEKVLTHTVDGLEIVTGDPVASQMMSGLDNDGGIVPSGGCAAGVSGVTFLPDGTIIPCRRLPVPIGNIRKDSLREVWATSEVLEMLRDKSLYKDKCGSCKRWAQCRGCRAIAYAYSQAQGCEDILHEDPQCFIDDECNVSV